MLLELAAKHNIDMENSFMIGDKVIDAECGMDAKCTGILLGKEDSRFRSFKTLTEFAEFL